MRVRDRALDSTFGRHISHKYVRNVFIEEHKATIGANFMSKKVVLSRSRATLHAQVYPHTERHTDRYLLPSCWLCPYPLMTLFLGEFDPFFAFLGPFGVIFVCVGMCGYMWGMCIWVL